MTCTVKDLIIILLDADMDSEIVIKDKEGNELHDISIIGRKNPHVLAGLFG